MLGIHKPARYPSTDPTTPNEIVDEEMLHLRDNFKPGKRREDKIKRTIPMPAGMYGPVAAPIDVVRGKDEPGFSLGMIGVNVGTQKGRREQSLRYSDTYTPEISEIMRAKGLDKAVEMIALTPKLIKYTAGGIAASNIAALALPGIGAPMILPLMVGSRLYRSTMQTRTDYEKWVYGNKANENFRSKMILAGTNVIMAPFDIATAVTSNAAAFAINFVAGKTLLNKIPDALASLDQNLEGLKPIDDGMTNNILNAVDKVSNILTFDQPAAQHKKVA